MMPQRSRARRSTAAVLLGAALLTVSACKSDLDIDVGDPIDPGGDPVIAVSATEKAVWGNGRGLLARTVDDGTSVVVTTIGVYTVTDGAAPTRIHEFAEPTLPSTLAISPAADTLVVATSTPTRLLWFDLTKRELTDAQDLVVGSSITSIEFGPDGASLVAGSATGLAVWPDGPLSGPIPLTDTGSSIGTWAVTGDGRVVAPLSNTDAIAISEGLETTFVQLDDLGDATVADAHSTPNGDLLAVTVGEGADLLERKDRVRVLDATTLDLQADIAFDRSLALTEWTVTDTHVAVAAEATVDVVTIDGEPVTTLVDSSDRPVERLLPLRTGLVVVHSDGAMTAWDSATWTPTPLADGGTAVTDATVEADGTTITTIDFHGRLIRWDTTTGTAITDIRSFAFGTTTGVAVDLAGLSVGVSTSSGQVALLDGALAEQWVFEPSPSFVDSVEFNPVSGRLATGLAERTGEQAFDDTVTSWDPTTRSQRFHVGGESEEVAGCAFFYNRIRFTGDGGLMATTSHDFSVAIIDADTGEVVDRVPPRPSTVLDVGFTPDDDLLVTTSDDSTVTVFDTLDYSVATEYQSMMGGYLAIAMLPDSATMAASDITGGIALVDIMTGERLLEFTDATQRTTSIAVSADGTMLAAPSIDSTVGIWSVDSGARLATLAGHTAAVTDVAFSPDGTWLVSSSADATVRAWAIAATTSTT